MKAIKFIVVIFVALFASAAVTAAEQVERGTVLAIEASRDPNPSFAQSNAGAGLGAALGGAIAYRAARNSDNRYAASALGTTLGGLVGNRVDRRRQGSSTYSIVVQLDGGRVVAVTDSRPRVSVGQAVYMIGGNRVIPATAGAM